MSARRTKKPKAPYHDHYDLIFRGYGEDDKIKRKNNAPLKEFEEVSGSRDLVGIFKDDIVMIDVDDKHSADIIFKILNDLGVSFLYQETTRGKHFFFEHGKYNKILRDRNGVLAAVGLHVDYKCHNVDCTQLVKDAEPRPVLKSENFNELEELPYYLMPTTADEEFLGLKQGAGRNETCYMYILTLLRYGLSKEEVRHTITLINNYVLGDPFTERELKTILRDEAFPTMNEVFIYKQPGQKTAKLDYELFSKYLIEKYHIIKVDKLIYRYYRGLYVAIDDYIKDEIIMSELKNTVEKTRFELIKYLRMYSPEKAECDSRYTLFNNCVYDFKEKQILSLNENMVFFNKIPHDFIPDAPPMKIVDDYFKTLSCNDVEVTNLLIELYGYCLIRNNMLDRFFLLYGHGASGKSDYLTIATKLLGKENVSFRDLKDLEDSKGVGALKNKLLNIGDDVDPQFIEACSNIKKLSTGQEVTGKLLYKDPFDFIYRGKMLFSCNEIPHFKDKSTGLGRRLVILPMKAKFKKDNQTDSKDRIFGIVDLMCEERSMEYLLRLAMEAAQRLYDSKNFTLPTCVLEATEEFNIENNPLLGFLNQYGELENKYKDEVYLSYNTWCLENNYMPVTEQKFSRCIKDNYSYTGKQVKVPSSKGRVSKYIYTKGNQLTLIK